MKILITTGIYPPEIGGPAQYSKNLKLALEAMGNKVFVRTFSVENYFPTGLRHIFFFLKIIPKVISSDAVFVFDQFSTGLPTIFACKIFGRKSVIRTGGDFLWEEYVERTGKMILFRNFYKEEMDGLSTKERVIFNLTKWTLTNASKVVFSTVWQRDIFISAYSLDIGKTEIIENYYGPKEEDAGAESKVFVASSRNLKWKNLESLRKIFDSIMAEDKEVVLFTDNLPYIDFMDKIRGCYAVAQVSIGDISPNMILDSIRCGKPFICTRDVGILPRIKDVGIFVDPLNTEEIKQAVLYLLIKENYEKEREKIRAFSFVHSWQDIASEFLRVNQFIK